MSFMAQLFAELPASQVDIVLKTAGEFEEAWQASPATPPEIDDYSRELSVGRASLLLELIRIDIECRHKYQASRQFDVDDYLQ
ncbi:MAG: hypothetical protein KDA84_11605, partial [Planctomycetaceae bacterium]|nr:hypothetical protein [Planctomycetaceae bacterium]